MAVAGILVFINKKMIPTLAVPLENLGKLLKQLKRKVDEVIEVNGARCFEAVLMVFEERLRERIKKLQ